MSKYEQAIDYLQPIADNAELSGYSEALEVALSAMRDAERQRNERKNAREINCAAMETYGKEAQKSKLFEEIGELMEALCKCAAGRDKVVHLAEEIADVGIMLEQMAILFDCEEEVERQRRYKLRRLEQRVEEARSESNFAVHRSVYDQCAWERDLAIEQLRNDYGVGLGEKKSADVVEVVRCKDCKYWHEETGWCYQHSHFIKYGENGVAFCHPWESADWKMFDADYFCKDGERRDNDAAD